MNALTITVVARVELEPVAEPHTARTAENFYISDADLELEACAREAGRRMAIRLARIVARQA